jgi:hypothetical protein
MIMDMIHESLEKAGIWFSQFPTIEDGNVAIYLTLYDVDGNLANVEERRALCLLLTSPLNRFGTIISYARRYRLFLS